jgi:hypothetical protein
MQTTLAPFSDALADIERECEGILPDVFEIRVDDHEVAASVMHLDQLDDIEDDMRNTVTELERRGFDVHVSHGGEPRATVLSCVRMLAQWLF